MAYHLDEEQEASKRSLGEGAKRWNQRNDGNDHGENDPEKKWSDSAMYEARKGIVRAQRDTVHRRYTTVSRSRWLMDSPEEGPPARGSESFAEVEWMILEAKKRSSTSWKELEAM